MTDFTNTTNTALAGNIRSYLEGTHQVNTYDMMTEAARRLAAIDQPKPESGWCIEHVDSKPSQPYYWSPQALHVGGSADILRDWTPDHALAVRFARLEDATIVRNSLSTEHRVAEHIWG